MRYQLLKTTPYLSGQIRWDIPLYYHYGGKMQNNVVVDTGVHFIDTPELHIVPLDDNIPFVDSKKNPEETFNYTHLENIKQLASQIGGSMYSSQGEWDGNYWLYNSGDILDPYSHIFNMGARRMPFKKYNKQFSYLCPLWISEETNPELFTFEISLKVIGEERDHIVRRRFKLSDKICKYMDEYLSKSARYLKPDPSSSQQPKYQGVSDDLLSIKFNPDYAYITGIHTMSGKYVTCDITYLIGSILDREVPMMEFDNMLVSKFRENNMIAQQLINLNFAFNIDDISYFLKDAMFGKSITMTMRVLYEDKYLDIKDFYTNYTQIPGYRVDRAEMSKSINVCDYLGDEHIIDYLYTNKFTQPIFHWSMVENPSYIYNFYNGFSPVFKDLNTGEMVRVEGRYYDQADISQLYHNPYNSAAMWCKLVDYKQLSKFNVDQYVNLVHKEPDKYASKLIMNKDTGIFYLNNNRFDVSKLRNYDEIINEVSKKQIYFYSIINKKFTIDIGGVSCKKYLHIYQINNDIFFELVCDDFTEATYRMISGLVEQFMEQYKQDPGHPDPTIIPGFYFDVFGIDPNDPNAAINEMNDYINQIMPFINLFIEMYDCWIPPYRIDFSKGTVMNTVPAFDEYHPQETTMHKYDAYDSHVLRYTGALCPMFIDSDDRLYKNKVYRYKQWGTITDPDVQQYNKMLKTKQEPLYPSIDFYSLVEEDDNITRPEWYDEIVDGEKRWPWEMIWKNDGLLFILPEHYEEDTDAIPPFEYNEDNEEILWKILYDYIESIGVQINTSWKKHKLKNIYEILYDFDYASETDIDKVIYHVKFILR